jgi:hypothetical protein
VVKKIKINSSEHCNQESTCGCEECKELFCSDCFKQHLTSKKFKNHRKTKLSKNPKCVNHPTAASEVFCFEDKCCLCLNCASLDHKDHDVLEIEEAIQRIQKEISSFSPDEEIQTIEDSLKEINGNISKRNEKYQQDLKKIKEEFMKDLTSLEEPTLKLNATLNELKEKQKNFKSSNMLVLMKLMKEYYVPEEPTEMYAYGNNEGGQLGLGNTTYQRNPQLVSFFENEKVKIIACGRNHNIILTGNSIIL